MKEIRMENKTDPLVPDDAIKAAMDAWGVSGNRHQRELLESLLEAAAPHFYAACGRADYGQHPLGESSDVSDYWTAPDPRVGEIEARVANHSKSPGGIYGPGSDVAYLLAELRKAHEALRVAKAEALEEAADKILGPSDVPLDAATCRWNAMELREAAFLIRAAVAAANGDGQ